MSTLAIRNDFHEPGVIDGSASDMPAVSPSAHQDPNAGQSIRNGAQVGGKCYRIFTGSFDVRIDDSDAVAPPERLVVRDHLWITPFAWSAQLGVSKEACRRPRWEKIHATRRPLYREHAVHDCSLIHSVHRGVMAAAC